MKKMLVKFGFDVRGDTDPREAHDRFVSSPHEFDLVITDMTMPGMTGIQFIEKIKKMREDIPVILNTGYSDRVNLGNAGAFGIDMYMEKPVDKIKLAETVLNVLAHR